MYYEYRKDGEWYKMFVTLQPCVQYELMQTSWLNFHKPNFVAITANDWKRKINNCLLLTIVDS
jgi:hypothetical protein